MILEEEVIACTSSDDWIVIVMFLGFICYLLVLTKFERIIERFQEFKRYKYLKYYDNHQKLQSTWAKKNL